MKAKFMSFVDRLSRHEMRAIMGGYDPDSGGGDGGGGGCTCLPGDGSGTCSSTRPGKCACTSNGRPREYDLSDSSCG